MGLYAYALRSGKILAYDVLDDGSLVPLGDPAPLSFPTNNSMCASGDTVFALGLGPDETTYVDIYQADRASGQLIPRLLRHPLGNFDSGELGMAATAPTDEVIYFYSCGEPYTDNDTPSTTLYAFIYSRARHVVFPIGQLPLPGGGEATTLQFDGTGKMLYASVSNGDYSPASFAIDAKGMPTLTDKVPMVNPLQFGLAVDPTQKYVYTGSAEFFNPEVRGYSVSQGVFSPLKGVADHTKSMVSVMTMSLDGKYLFLSTTASPFTGIGKNTVVSYAVNPLTGVLTPINEQADGREVLAIAVTPDGKYLYAASAREDTIYRYGIDQGALSTGTLVANAGMEIDGFVLVSEP